MKGQLDPIIDADCRRLYRPLLERKYETRPLYQPKIGSMDKHEDRLLTNHYTKLPYTYQTIVKPKAGPLEGIVEILY